MGGSAGYGRCNDWVVELLEGLDEGEEPWELELSGPALANAPRVEARVPVRGPEVVHVLVDCIERTRGAPGTRDVRSSQSPAWRHVWVELELGRPGGPEVVLIKPGKYDDRYDLRISSAGAHVRISVGSDGLDELLAACRDLCAALEPEVASLPPERLRWSGVVFTTATAEEIGRECWVLDDGRLAFRLG